MKEYAVTEEDIEAALNYAAELVESESELLNEEEANFDGIVKSRHFRETCPRQRSGNGNPENSNYLKILDSCLRRND